MTSATPSDPEQVARLLAEASSGNVDALNRVFPYVYEELRRIAHRQLVSERDGHTLNTTALVHEAYLRLAAQRSVEWQNEAHLYGLASQAMRRILVNYAEMRRAGKRGGGAVHVPLDETALALNESQIDELLAVDQALCRLRTFNERGADVVAYRFFGGLPWDDIASIMGTSEVTVRRAWTAARSWLRRELRDAPASVLAELTGAPVTPAPS
jgi:RNA polymerase sigma factor (TIGR02999 family)